MSDGWDAIAQAEEESKRRREANAQRFGNRIFLKNDESVTVRFLQEQPFVYHTHSIPPAGSRSYETEICLNQKDDGTPCPGCEAGLKRGLRAAWNVIHRNRPQLRKDANGRAIKDGSGNYIVDSYADDIAILDLPQTGAAKVRKKNLRYHGIQSRDWDVSKTGAQFDPYDIEPHDPDAGPVAMTEADQAFLEKLYDLAKAFSPPDYGEFARKLGMAAGAAATPAPGSGNQQAGDPAGGNVFLQKRG